MLTVRARCADLLRYTKSDEDRNFIYTNGTAYYTLIMKRLSHLNGMLLSKSNYWRIFPGKQTKAK